MPIIDALLAELEHPLLGWHDVAAVAVDQHNPPEAMKQKVFDHVAEHVEIDARRGGHRASEIEVVLRVAQPHQWREQDSIRECFPDPADDLTEQQAVREDGQVMSMLLEGGNGNDHGSVLRKRPNRRPGKFG